MDELLKRLNRYSKKCIAERTDDDFADAVDQAKEMLKACRNELCYKCRDYKTAHLGSCDGCRWKWATVAISQPQEYAMSAKKD